ncbi:MAG: hypothetical protein KZQ93_08515 [Candidatus Thiodiazotropha sp. (ex Monitilora ramsayi)]|nr:hypothetical protein [Candidatus Thiodiazotropha sp. (ex Monitilora ramsayi)]
MRLTIYKIPIAPLWMMLMMPMVQAEIGNEAWVTRYNGPGDKKDNPVSLALDHTGNAYVSGFSDSGNGNYDFATIKYDNQGNEVWIAYYDGKAQGPDWVSNSVVDQENNVVVSGSSLGEGTGLDFLTIKYDTKGLPLWVNRYDGPSHGDDRVTAMVTDMQGNVYVTGQTATKTNHHQSVIIKYGASGDFIWEINELDQCTRYTYNDLALDQDGNLYATGKRLNQKNNYDYLTVKYDSFGQILWRTTRDWSATDDARWITLDSENSVYIAGSSLNKSNGSVNNQHEDVALVKYDQQGNELWSISYNGGPRLNDVISALQVDLQGNVLLTGTTYGSTQNTSDESDSDIFIVKYNKEGRLLWSTNYSGPGNTHDIASSMSIDTSGAIYILGTELDSKTRTSWLITFKIDRHGHGQWVSRHEGISASRNSHLSIDHQSNDIWIIGTDSSANNYLTIKYNQLARDD